ncbi:DUF86 domain-containing protein [Niallia taxi]|uniref:DUF86 domain-containing protein n=1 Tax=Niallia taxi TaxID=2499688 RepID=A0A3S2UWV8_9BACI|nr:DUF86 domain-containing protein [Niallia taxi]MCM3217138.1 DUF86 domain-containing protein [Niallia taxi]MDK8642608.1 DUF86 domain-containing protein [Niallia taxi]MED4037349.1 DUF86 domain-containing protein [Niallia taxi]MED4054764.1 DUF86 domain-containing protein [Niallia taxi]MED4121224.1 DUF86 domain-containing protein [Niallia taxi]
MYFVDRDKIGQQLEYLQQLVQLFKETEAFDSPLEKLGLERLAHMMIEAMLDVGNSMIDGFIMRDPGSYEDIMDILTDERVLIPTDASSIKELLVLRKTLVHDYTSIHHDWLREAVAKELPAVESFSTSVKKYLIDELGPVTAFKN